MNNDVPQNRNERNLLWDYNFIWVPNEWATVQVYIHNTIKAAFKAQGQPNLC